MTLSDGREGETRTLSDFLEQRRPRPFDLRRFRRPAPASRH